MKRIYSLLITILLMAAQTVMAGVPDGYYKTIDGEQYTDLKSRLCDIISNHTVLGYSSLWNYYPATYYVPTNKTQVLDMYSDEVRYYNGTSAVTGMNKEHTVPKSWWGGSTSAAPGNDLYNVIPSDQDANSRKSNYPLGKVTTKSWSNGVTTVGKGTVNGYSDTFFEPKDEYKGDFARIYFYMAVCYPDLAWDTNNAKAMTNKSSLTLQSWIIPMLIEWHKADPVDKDEIQRNEDIYRIQKNRNPFIDYPELVDYIWGSKTNEMFELSEHEANSGSSTTTLTAGKPVFSVAGGTESAPYQMAEGAEVTIKGGNSSATLYVRINDGDWKTYAPTKGWNSTSQSEYYTAASTTVTISGTVHVEAYCSMDERDNSEVLDYWYKGVVFDNEYLLYEAFDEVTSGNNEATSGSSAAWSGNSNFPTVVKTYQAGGALKLGTGSATGSITSKTLNFAGGSLSVTLDVKGWTTVEGKLKVSVTGAEDQIVEYTSKMENDFETITLNFENVSAQPVITIATTTKRAFIDNVKVSAGVSNGIKPTTNTSASTSAYDLSGRRTTATSSAHGISLIKANDGSVRKVIKR